MYSLLETLPLLSRVGTILGDLQYNAGALTIVCYYAYH